MTMAVTSLQMAAITVPVVTPLRFFPEPVTCFHVDGFLGLHNHLGNSQASVILHYY